MTYAAGALLGETRRDRVTRVTVTRGARGTRVVLHYADPQGPETAETTVLYRLEELLPLVEQAERQCESAVVLTAGEDLWITDGALTRALVTDRLTGRSMPGLLRERPTLVLRKGTRWRVSPAASGSAGPGTSAA